MNGEPETKEVELHFQFQRTQSLLKKIYQQAILQNIALKRNLYIVSEVKSLSCVRLFVTPWSIAYQAPPSMEFSRQEYWSGLHFLLQGIFPTQGSNLHLWCLLHWHVCVLSHVSRVQLFATLWTVAHQAPQSMGFSRQEYWSGLLFPTTGDVPNPGIEPAFPALAGGFFTTSTTWEAPLLHKLPQGLAA